MHLLLPLLASVLLVMGLIMIKRAGVSPVTTLFFSNQCTAILFSVLWLFDGQGQPWTMLWQPALIALLFVMGLMLMFLAIERGDVSVATPVIGLKVFIVALLLTIFTEQRLSLAVWLGAALAAAGIALIQWTGRSHPQRVVFTIFLALSSACTFATIDVLVQSWAPAWGASRFLPIVFGIVGLASLGLIPWVDWPAVGSGAYNLVVGRGTDPF